MPRKTTTSRTKGSKSIRRKLTGSIYAIFAILFIFFVPIAVIASFFVESAFWAAVLSITSAVLLAAMIIANLRLGRKNHVENRDRLVRDIAARIVRIIETSNRWDFDQAQRFAFAKQEISAWSMRRKWSFVKFARGAFFVLFFIFLASAMFFQFYLFIAGEEFHFYMPFILSLESISKGLFFDLIEAYGLSPQRNVNNDLAFATVDFLTRSLVSFCLVGSILLLARDLFWNRAVARETGSRTASFLFAARIDAQVQERLTHVLEIKERAGESVRLYKQVVFPIVWEQVGQPVSIDTTKLFALFRMSASSTYSEEGFAEWALNNNGLAALPPKTFQASPKTIQDQAIVDIFSSIFSGTEIWMSSRGLRIDRLNYQLESKLLEFVLEDGTKHPLGSPLKDEIHERVKRHRMLRVLYLPNEVDEGGVDIVALHRI